MLCEKPIALDAAEARNADRRRATHRRKSGREAFMVRFHPQWRRAREIAQSGAIGEVSAIQTLFAYRLLDPDNIRNRPPGGGGLYDIGCYAILTARFIFGAEPLRVAALRQRRSAVRHGSSRQRDRRISGGRHLTFSAGTQLAGAQGLHRGRAGPDRGQIPFNAPIDRPTEIVIDPGADLLGGGRRVETFPICDQYTLQGDAFSRAIVDGAPLEFPIEDAIANMAVIDALFRSAKSGTWEKP